MSSFGILLAYHWGYLRAFELGLGLDLLMVGMKVSSKEIDLVFELGLKLDPPMVEQKVL